MIFIILIHITFHLTTGEQQQYSMTNQTADVRKSHRFTLLLDRLLNSYDKNLRPNFGDIDACQMNYEPLSFIKNPIKCLGPPTIVEIDFNVRSMGPISEVDMTFSMDCYFRQTWLDSRLSFTGVIQTVTLGISTLDKIWKPDTYFLNGQQSYLHTVTVPNRFVRINQEGRVLYSQRLTVKATCPMNLANFPIDTQICPLELTSFGYSTNDMMFRWNSLRRVVIASDMKMSQFDLIASPSKNYTTTLRNRKFSTLSVNFHLQRHTGYFLIQVYAPCILLVVLSWVGFWINREATADRVALGVTTMLTMTFLGLDSRNDLPKVSYSTALDSFMAISFSFVLATIIQFALVHHYTKRGSGEVYFISDNEDEDDDDDDEEDNEEVADSSFITKTQRNRDSNIVCLEDPVFEVDISNVQQKSDRGTIRPQCIPTILQRKIRSRKECFDAPHVQYNKTQLRDTLSQGRQYNNSYDDTNPPLNRVVGSANNDARNPCNIVKCCRNITRLVRRTRLNSSSSQEARRRRRRRRRTSQIINIDRSQLYDIHTSATSNPFLRRNKKSHDRTNVNTINLEEINSVSKIDSASRILFPVCYLVLNLFYWFVYLSVPNANDKQ